MGWDRVFAVKMIEGIDINHLSKDRLADIYGEVFDVLHFRELIGGTYLLVSAYSGSNETVKETLEMCFGESTVQSIKWIDERKLFE